MVTGWLLSTRGLRHETFCDVHESSLSAVANVPSSGLPLVDSCSELEASLSTVAIFSSSGLPLVDSGSELVDTARNTYADLGRHFCWTLVVCVFG